MLKSLKTAFAITLAIGILLLPYAYAGETVEVGIYKDSERVSSASVGDTITLIANLSTAQTGDSVTFVDTNQTLVFLDQNGSEISGSYEVAAVVNEAGNWSASTQARVISENPIQIEGQVNRVQAQAMDLTTTEKPQQLSITLSQRTAQSGDSITAQAYFTPQETTDYRLLSYVNWDVRYNDTAIPMDTTTGETIQFTIPKEAVGSQISVSATLPGQTAGLGSDLVAETKTIDIPTNDLHVDIYPSTNDKTILVNTDIGFSSEILQGEYIAPDKIREDAQYNWEAKLDSEFLNPSLSYRKPTYSVYPERLGTLTVTLTVTLNDGTELVSEPIVKQIVDKDTDLSSITLRQVAQNQEKDVVLGSEVQITHQTEPASPTNLTEATYLWSVKKDNEEITTSDTADDLKFTPEELGNYQITLTITPKDGDAVTSKVLTVNVIENGPVEVPDPVTIRSVELNADSTSLPVGSTAHVKATTQTDGDPSGLGYSWKAYDSKGNVFATNNASDTFDVTPKSAGKVRVDCEVLVKNSSDSGAVNSVSVIRSLQLNFTDEETNQNQIEKDKPSKESDQSETTQTTDQSKPKDENTKTDTTIEVTKEPVKTDSTPEVSKEPVQTDSTPEVSKETDKAESIPEVSQNPVKTPSSPEVSQGDIKKNDSTEQPKQTEPERQVVQETENKTVSNEPITLTNQETTQKNDQLEEVAEKTDNQVKETQTAAQPVSNQNLVNASTNGSIPNQTVQATTQQQSPVTNQQPSVSTSLANTITPTSWTRTPSTSTNYSTGTTANNTTSKTSVASTQNQTPNPKTGLAEEKIDYKKIGFFGAAICIVSIILILQFKKKKKRTTPHYYL